MLQYNDQLPVGSLAQLVGAFHRYHRGQGSNPGKPDFFSGFPLATKKLHLLLFIYFFIPLFRCMKFIIIRHFSYIHVLSIAKLRGNSVYKALIYIFSWFCIFTTTFEMFFKQVVICCVTRRYCKSEMCQREVTLAGNLRKPIIPLLFEFIDWPPAGQLALIFTKLLYIDMSLTPGNFPDNKLQELFLKVRNYVEPRWFQRTVAFVTFWKCNFLRGLISSHL